MTLLSATILATLIHVAPVLRHADEIQAVINRQEQCTHDFRITATVVETPYNKFNFTVRENGRCIPIFQQPTAPLKAGDVVHLVGRVIPTRLGPQAHVSSANVISHGIPPPPIDCTADDIVSGRYENQFVRIKGEIIDAYYDDIDARFSFFVLNTGATIFHVPLFNRPPLPKLHSLIGAHVAASGICKKHPTRIYSNPEIHIAGLEKLQIIRKAPEDPYNVPDLFSDTLNTPDQYNILSRRGVCGRVCATWNKNRLLLYTASGKTVQVSTMEPRLPPIGTTIDVVGLPDANAYNINLVRSIWRTRHDNITPFPQPEETTIRDLLCDSKGLYRINASHFGHLVRLRGTVRGLSILGDNEPVALLEDENVFLRLESGTAEKTVRDLPLGSKVEVTGICALDVETWRPQTPSQRIQGIYLVARSPEDVRILSLPPWWTPGRLLSLVALLFTCVSAILIWNRHLKHHIELRSRELLDEQIAHVTSELKTMERTRLAIELHDSISQNLTGIALELQTVHDTMNTRTEVAAQRLSVATRSLTSCREELRNCLRDLRSEALEIADINEAIRMTLAPHIANSNVFIRFNVPRERLTDNTMHALLRIIRELVQNALRHGNATSVRVAGALEDGKLLFSVSDNGSGFDPNACPGISEGHFGLQGIQDRIDNFGGIMQINSESGTGTKITISINLPQEDEK